MRTYWSSRKRIVLIPLSQVTITVWSSLNIYKNLYICNCQLLFWTKYISKLRVTNNIKICFDKTALTWEHNNWGSKIIGASWFWILDRKHLFSFKISLWMDILILRHSGQAIENIFEDIWRFRDYCICNLIIMIMTSDLFVTIAEALYFW